MGDGAAARTATQRGAAGAVGCRRPFDGVGGWLVGGRAAAEAAKLSAGLSFGWIEATANLGVELYDVVTVDGTEVRVVGITETWERGRLWQRLELGEVNSFAVWVG